MNAQRVSIVALLALLHNPSQASVAPVTAPAAVVQPAPKVAEVKAVPAPKASAPAEPVVATPTKNEPSAPVIKKYEAENYFGVPVRDDKNTLLYVDEHKSQTHSKDHYVMVRVKNIKARAGDKEIGRVRVAVWSEGTKDSYAKEGVAPFRASSHLAKDTVNGEMVFKIAGLEKGKSYAFFAHFDQNNKGKVERNFIGIPKDPFIFSNAANQGKGKGLTRDGLSAPKFEKTLVSYAAPGQEIILAF